MTRNLPQTLATVIVGPLQRCIPLPTTLGLHLGERLMLESGNGDVLPTTVELGTDHALQFTLPCLLATGAGTLLCRIRRPRLETP